MGIHFQWREISLHWKAYVHLGNLSNLYDLRLASNPLRVCDANTHTDRPTHSYANFTPSIEL